jgi:hypothetical protein
MCRTFVVFVPVFSFLLVLARDAWLGCGREKEAKKKHNSKTKRGYEVLALRDFAWQN